MKSAVTPDEIKGVATRRLDQLRLLTFDEISVLPACTEEVVILRNGEIKIGIYSDRMVNGSFRVVVQAYYHRVLFIGTMTADGFVIAPDGSQSAVPQKMMWEFI